MQLKIEKLDKIGDGVNFLINNKIRFEICDSFLRSREFDIKRFAEYILDNARNNFLIKDAERFEFLRVKVWNDGRIMATIKIDNSEEDRTFAESDNFCEKFIMND